MSEGALVPGIAHLTGEWFTNGLSDAVAARRQLRGVGGGSTAPEPQATATGATEIPTATSLIRNQVRPRSSSRGTGQSDGNQRACLRLRPVAVELQPSQRGSRKPALDGGDGLPRGAGRIGHLMD